MAQFKRKQINCNCPAYPFVHRLDSGKCAALYNSGSDDTYMTRQQWEYEMLRDFDRTEAQAINKGVF